MDKPPCVERGKPFNWCARDRFHEQIEGRILLPNDWWKGWRISKGHLIGPGGMRFTPRLLMALHRLERLRERRRHANPQTQS